MELLYFPKDLRSAIEAIDPFVHVFSQSIGPTGTMVVDVLEPETVTIQFSEADPRTMAIRWSWSGKNQAFAYNSAGIDVALAREAREFSEIDDPGIFKFGPQARVLIGNIVIFCHQDAYLLAKVLEAKAGPSYGDEHYLVKFQYQIRLRSGLNSGGACTQLGYLTTHQGYMFGGVYGALTGFPLHPPIYTGV